MGPNTSTKYDLENFDGYNDFSLWRMKMRAVLIEQGLLKALKGKQGLPDTMSSDEKEDMKKAHVAAFSRQRVAKGLSKNDCDWIVAEIGELIHDVVSDKSPTTAVYFYNERSSQAACGVIRILQGALVLMPGLKQNSLYLLQGSTVIGAATTVSYYAIDSNTTKLWHMRLGHMSEKGMDVLSKQGFLGSKKNGWIFVSIVSSRSSAGDVTFDESLMLSKKEELIDAGKDHSVREKAELEVRAPDSLPIIPTDEDDGSHSIEENEEPQEQQYSIARNRSRREIRPP
ncbi:hypothetical protein RJ640_017431 [Escallonia rubra]|uniref:GAG-pre-integrase domain-containing protein n=1 Tax=Escallonia rubra TaxID=112253 RepID=A0AA88S3K5_9ASTE|nr:hypothetical protein RJ640_017431 [Escallonia rubra]